MEGLAVIYLQLFEGLKRKPFAVVPLSDRDFRKLEELAFMDLIRKGIRNGKKVS